MKDLLVEEFVETREIRKDMFAICCPVCGKYHYKMLEGHGMFVCEKCRRGVEFIVRDGRVTLFAERRTERPLRMKVNA